jgi:dipeptidyl aminopeptidase/acylaminoacyl peptidase
MRHFTAVVLVLAWSLVGSPASATPKKRGARARVDVERVLSDHELRVSEPVKRFFNASGADRSRVQSSFDEHARAEIETAGIDHRFRQALSGEMIYGKVQYPSEDGMMIPAYVFGPKDTSKKHPVVILPHGGYHWHFDFGNIDHVRSLVKQGWVVVAPEYRGSTGYGRAHHDAIDYGGQEVEDCTSALSFLQTHLRGWADTSRAAMLGWSHGGFISLHAAIRNPKLRAAAAHVPVSDLPVRMLTHMAPPMDLQDLFAAESAFAGTYADNPGPYIDRSVTTHADKLQVPVLVHAATDDKDVFPAEVAALNVAMHRAGKNEAGLYQQQWFPGGHSFSRERTADAARSWDETIRFLQGHLKRTPPRKGRPVKRAAPRRARPARLRAAR